MLPLDEIKVVEIAGLGPVPFAGMLLAELGADVVRIDRTRSGGFPDPMLGAVGRGRRSIAIDLKHRNGVDVVLRLVAGADVLLEGFRPGVVERLGIGPEECLAVNPRLVAEGLYPELADKLSEAAPVPPRRRREGLLSKRRTAEVIPFGRLRQQRDAREQACAQPA